MVDDGSTYSTGEIIDKYKVNKNVIVIHKDNGGLSSARNAAIEKIFAKYILFVDSDDMLLPNAIEALVSTAEEKMRK